MRGGQQARLNAEFSKLAGCRTPVQVEFNARRRDCIIGVVPTIVIGSRMFDMFTALFRRQMLVMAAAMATALYTPVPQAAEISPDQAVDRVQQQTGGKVLSVQTLRVGKRKIFRIKVLTPSGQVRVVEVQADQ